MKTRTICPMMTSPNGGGFRVRAFDPGADAPQPPRRPLVT